VAPGAQVHCPVGVKWLVASVTYNLFEDSSSTMLSFSKPKDHGYSNSSPCAVTLRTLILATLPETLPDDQTPSLTVAPKSKHDATSGVYSLGQVGHLPSSAVWIRWATFQALQFGCCKPTSHLLTSAANRRWLYPIS
jgi:hypothetical protein